MNNKANKKNKIRFYIKIMGSGKAQKVKLFDAFNNNDDLSGLKVEIVQSHNGLNKAIEYIDFKKMLLVNTCIVKYVSFELNGDANFSLHRIDKNADGSEFFIGSVFLLDCGFFIIADFLYHGRRSSGTIILELIT